MKIFLSFASEDRSIAEEIVLALRNEGHKVYFSDDFTEPGNNYNKIIRRKIESCDKFLFLVSPNSIRQGKYTLTELKFVEQKWPAPKDRVIPVVVSNVDISAMPKYLTSVTVHEPTGNVAAEVAHLLDNQQSPKRRVLFALLGILFVGVAGSGMFAVAKYNDPLSVQKNADACAVLWELKKISDQSELPEAALRQSAICDNLQSTKIDGKLERDFTNALLAADKKEATNILVKLAEKNPNSVQAWERLADFSAWIDAEQELDARQRIKSLDPRNLSNRISLGNLQFDDVSAALPEFIQISEMSSDELIAAYADANICWLKSDPNGLASNCDIPSPGDVLSLYQNSTTDHQTKAHVSLELLGAIAIEQQTKLMSSTSPIELEENLKNFKATMEAIKSLLPKIASKLKDKRYVLLFDTLAQSTKASLHVVENRDSSLQNAKVRLENTFSELVQIDEQFAKSAHGQDFRPFDLLSVILDAQKMRYCS